MNTQQTKTLEHLANDLFITCDNEKQLNDFKRLKYISLFYDCGSDRKQVFTDIFNKFKEHYNGLSCMADSPKIYSEVYPAFYEIVADDYTTFFVGEEVVKDVNGKQPINNGSVNKLLTLEELLRFDIGRKARIIHNLNVSASFAHSFEGVEPCVFEPLQPSHDWAAIQSIMQTLDESAINEALKTTFENVQKHTQYLQTKTNDYLYGLGYEMPEVCKKYKIRGELQMELPQLLGYIAKSGSWNDFNVTNVSKALTHIENTFPRVNYGDNNPNTGRKQHKFSIKSDYIFVRVDYTNGLELDNIKTWFEENKQHIKNLSKCDSIRYESNDYMHDGHDFTLILWWD